MYCLFNNQYRQAGLKKQNKKPVKILLFVFLYQPNIENKVLDFPSSAWKAKSNQKQTNSLHSFTGQAVIENG